MTEILRSDSFVTEGRIQLARNYARELAAKDPWASAHSCSEKAVRTVFGKWLLDPTAAIRSEYLPLFFQLVNKVESQLGIHRRTTYPTIPSSPSVMQPHGTTEDGIDVVGAVSAIAV